jgi:hypothetical protein
MKKLKINPIEIDPETITTLSENNALEIEGGQMSDNPTHGSCCRMTCTTDNI